MKLHLVSIVFRGNTYFMFVSRPETEKKVTVSLDEFRDAFPRLFILPHQTFSIG